MSIEIARINDNSASWPPLVTACVEAAEMLSSSLRANLASDLEVGLAQKNM